jgi:hypothetical protein
MAGLFWQGAWSARDLAQSLLSPCKQGQNSTFVPNRVVSQRRFSGAAYREIESGKPIHQRIRGGKALRRMAAAESPQSALIWYSGESEATGRGAVMAYVPAGDSYCLWYAALETGESSSVSETLDIKREDLASLMEQGSDAIQSI